VTRDTAGDLASIMTPQETASKTEDDIGGHNRTSKEIPWRLILLITLVALTLLLVATPDVLIAVARSTNDYQRRASCWDFEGQDWTTEDFVIDSCALGNSHRLTASVCVDFLSQYWAGNLNYSNSDDSEERTVVLAEHSRCNWEEAERQLNLLFDYKTVISDGCWAELPRLLCRIRLYTHGILSVTTLVCLMSHRGTRYRTGRQKILSLTLVH
jgi:hypothetical protein